MLLSIITLFLVYAELPFKNHTNILWASSHLGFCSILSVQYHLSSYVKWKDGPATLSPVWLSLDLVSTVLRVGSCWATFRECGQYLLPRFLDTLFGETDPPLLLLLWRVLYCRSICNRNCLWYHWEWVHTADHHRTRKWNLMKIKM